MRCSWLKLYRRSKTRSVVRWGHLHLEKPLPVDRTAYGACRILAQVVGLGEKYQVANGGQDSLERASKCWPRVPLYNLVDSQGFNHSFHGRINRT